MMVYTIASLEAKNNMGKNKSLIPIEIRKKTYANRWVNKNKDNPEYKRKRYLAQKKYAQNNREKVNERARKWRKNNPKKVAIFKANRYAMDKGAEGRHTLTEWLSVLFGEAYKCVMCGVRGRLTKDHIIPLSKGGTNYIWNIQPLCRSCNSIKHDKII